MWKLRLDRRFVNVAALVTVGACAAILLPRWVGGPVPAQTGQAQSAAGAEARLRQLGLELPPPFKTTNPLAPAVRVGNWLFVSGHGPTKTDGTQIVGRLGLPPGSLPAGMGPGLDVKEGQAAARLVGLNILSTVRAELGSLDKVVRVVKTLGMVQATPDFKQHPQVVNGFSDLMIEILGDKAGKSARSAVGMSSLPGGIPVEIEVIFEVRP